MGARDGIRQAQLMADDQLLTTTEYAALASELRSLRCRHRAELAIRLREARDSGGGPDGDHLQTVLEEAAIDESRIAQLEEQLRCARVVDVALALKGAVGVGALVRVVDDDGREREYEIVGRRSPTSRRHEVTPASPVGEALIGARAGDAAHIRLPDGGRRQVRVLAVRYPRTGDGS
jgi:transcription elongation factor GreA